MRLTFPRRTRRTTKDTQCSRLDVGSLRIPCTQNPRQSGIPANLTELNQSTCSTLARQHAMIGDLTFAIRCSRGAHLLWSGRLAPTTSQPSKPQTTNPFRSFRPPPGRTSASKAVVCVFLVGARCPDHSRIAAGSSRLTKPPNLLDSPKNPACCGAPTWVPAGIPD